MSSSNTVKEETHLESHASDNDSHPTSKDSESSAFVDSLPSVAQPSTYPPHAGDKTNAASTAIHLIYPADTITTSTKEQRDRIIEAIKSVTDKPEEIHHCLLGEVLVFAKASMTAAQAAVLRGHPDVSAVTSYRGVLKLTPIDWGCVR